MWIKCSVVKLDIFQLWSLYCLTTTVKLLNMTFLSTHTHYYILYMHIIVSYFFLQCFDTVGWRQEGHLACIKLDVGLLMVVTWLSFAHLIAPVVTTTSITFNCNKIQNGDILVPANPGPYGKWPLKRRDFKTLWAVKHETLISFSTAQMMHFQWLHTRMFSNFATPQAELNNTNLA